MSQRFNLFAEFVLQPPLPARGVDEHHNNREKSCHQKDGNTIHEVNHQVSKTEDSQDRNGRVISLKSINGRFVLLQVDKDGRCSCQTEESNQEVGWGKQSVDRKGNYVRHVDLFGLTISRTQSRTSKELSEEDYVKNTYAMMVNRTMVAII